MRAHLDFVVIGAQKGGSTLLARGISQHPDVWMPRDETPTFRDPVYSPAALAELLTELNANSDARVLGIKCPDYLTRSEVPGRLAELPQRPKLIACLRNPVSRAISGYYWHVRWGMLPIEDPSAGLRKVLDGYVRDKNPCYDEVLDMGFYARGVKRYLEYFKSNYLHVILSEDLRASPKRTFDDVFQFLALSAFAPLPNARSSNEGVYTPARLRFLNLRNRYILKWNDDHTYAEIPRATGIWPRFVSNGVAATDRYLLRRLYSNERPAIAHDVLDRLYEHYDADVKELEQLLSRDLSAWRRTAGGGYAGEQSG